MTDEPQVIPEFTIITELPGCGASREQLERLYQRYRFASEFCVDKRVLEVACGGGVGLGLLAKTAQSVLGGDIDPSNVRIAQKTWHGNPKISVLEFDTLKMPFNDSAFDVVLIFEAIYYLQDVDAFLNECRRVLDKGGVLIIESANKDWKDFNPSPFSHRYFSVSELYEKLTAHGFSVMMYKSYDDIPESAKTRLLSWIKRFAVRCGLIPKSMKFKQLFKRIFFGQLVRIPEDISIFSGPYIQPEPMDHGIRNLQFKVIYAVGKTGGSTS